MAKLQPKVDDLVRRVRKAGAIVGNQDPDDAGKSYAKKVAAASGGAIGFAIGQGIGASIAVPVSATFLVTAGPAVLAFGGAAVGAVGAYKLARRFLND